MQYVKPIYLLIFFVGRTMIMKIKGIMMLSEPLHCREDALTSYDCNVDGVPITIHFPLYFFRERGLSENKLDPPEIGKGLRREHSKIDWGYFAQYCIHPPTDKNEYVLAVVNTIAIREDRDRSTEAQTRS